MNLHSMLRQRDAKGRPVRVGLIGAGKFGSMFLAQVLHAPGMHLLGLADLAVERARASLARTAGLGSGAVLGRSRTRSRPVRRSSRTTAKH